VSPTRISRTGGLKAKSFEGMAIVHGVQIVLSDKKRFSGVITTPPRSAPIPSN